MRTKNTKGSTNLANEETYVTIIVDNPVTGRIGTGIKKVRPLLSYRSHYFRKNKYGRMVKKAYDKYVISAKGTFYLGLLSRIKSLCEKSGMYVKVQYSNEYLKFISEVCPNLQASLPKNDEFQELYPRQKELVKAALEGGRGYIVSPMGSGKSLLLMSVAEAFYQKGYKGLILVPGLSLLSKTESDLRKFGFDHLCVIGDGNSELENEILYLSTFQTFRNLDLEKLAFEFDYVLVDEAHLAMCQMSTYEQILSRLMAPVRIGFTATFPREKERAYNAEGLIGPILGEVTFDEARELEITVEPLVEIICVPASIELKDMKNYREIYEAGIVKHRMRNLLVVKKALELIRQRGKTVLIFSAEKNVEHGQAICDMIRKSGEECEYVYGGTDSETREGWLRELENGDLKCIVSSRVWREGVNIKSLGSLILAKGGKGLKESGEEAILQTVGRALRKADGKSEAVVVDFLDSCRYLSEHSAERIAAYRRMGWQVYID